jgi:phosphatidate cytidylyltransferase
MKRILTALVLIILVLAIVFYAKMWLFTLFIAFLSSLCGWEFLGLVSERGTANPPRIANLVALVLLFVGTYYRPDEAATIVGILSILLLLYCAFISPIERVIADASTSIACLLYTGLTLTTLPTIRAQSNGISLLIFLLFVVWAGDITALYIGRSWGRHKLIPKLSPNKTWEGTIGSIFGSLAVAGLLILFSNLLVTNLVIDSFFEKLSVHLFYSGEPWRWLAIAFVVNIAAQLGDLLESALKRSAGVKDSGNLLPGHGGMLDRIDALLIAAPVLWYAMVLQTFF